MDNSQETNPLQQKDLTKKPTRRELLKLFAAGGIASAGTYGIENKLLGRLFHNILSLFNSHKNSQSNESIFLDKQPKTQATVQQPKENTQLPSLQTDIKPSQIISESSPQSMPVEVKPPPEDILINQILALDPLSLQRKKLETLFVESANTPKLIDKGLMAEVIIDPYLRADLIKKRFEIRQSGKDESLKVLPDDLIEFALENGIHPEIFALSRDNYSASQKVIEILLKIAKNEFRPDLIYEISRGRLPQSVFDNLAADNVMINIAGMAKLTTIETGGVEIDYQFKGKNYRKIKIGSTQLGEKPAISEINSQEFPTGLADLKSLVLRLNKKTGLQFKVENIIGSAPDTNNSAGSNSASSEKWGGAVFQQIEPSSLINLLDFLDKYQEPFKASGTKLCDNFADINCQLIINWIFLARGQNVGTGFRFGYLKGTYYWINPQTGEKTDIGEDLRLDSLLKWNNDKKNEADPILKTANLYYENFIQKGRYSY